MASHLRPLEEQRNLLGDMAGLFEAGDLRVEVAGRDFAVGGDDAEKKNDHCAGALRNGKSLSEGALLSSASMPSDTWPVRPSASTVKVTSITSSCGVRP